MKIHFYIEHRPNKNNTHSLRCHLVDSYGTKLYPIQSIQIPFNYWNKKTERIDMSKPTLIEKPMYNKINEYLDETILNLTKWYFDLSKADSSLDAGKFLEQITYLEKINSVNYEYKFEIETNDERKIFHLSKQWKRLTYNIIVKRGLICEHCRKKVNKKDDDAKFEFHHLVPWPIVNFRLEPYNIIILCFSCHRFVHSKKNINKYYILSPLEFEICYDELKFLSNEDLSKFFKYGIKLFKNRFDINKKMEESSLVKKKYPNEETIEAIEDARNGRNLEHYNP